LDGYRHEMVVFTTRPELRAISHLLIPHDCRSPRATIVCLPGHGRCMPLAVMPMACSARWTNRTNTSQHHSLRPTVD
jgi:hypothetical protein